MVSVGHLIISTHPPPPFRQVPILKFGQGASAHVKGVDIVQGHLAYGVSGHQVPVCYFLLVPGQSTDLYSLISSHFKMASEKESKIMYTEQNCWQ